MFEFCYSLFEVNLNSITNVTSAANMFKYCYSLCFITATNFASNADSVSCSVTFDECEALSVINLPNAKVTRLCAKGASGKLNKLTSVTFHPSSTFSSTTAPQLDLQYTTLTAEQINTIFTALPTVTSKTVNVKGCIGAATCDTSIATAKGWTVVKA